MIRNNLRLILIGIFLILISLVVLLIKIINDAYTNHQETRALNNFYIEEKNNIEKKNEVVDVSTTTKAIEKYNYIAVLKIPKIDLERGLVDVNSKYNNVNYNIEILKESSMPDVENGNLILASHSGNSKISYFKNLNKLVLNDELIIVYKGKNYNYKVKNIYEIDKNGKAKIIRNKDINTLTLITCKRNSNKQIVIISELNK